MSKKYRTVHYKLPDWDSWAVAEVEEDKFETFVKYLENNGYQVK